MTINAKTILKDKFWIVEDEGKKIGTLAWNDDRYIFSSSSNTKFFDDTTELKNELGIDLTENTTISDVVVETKVDDDVYGYPSRGTPYNTMYDVRKKLPLFTKSHKSKSYYCAGYYLIKFNVKWLKSFCPKLITLERNEYLGPFKTKIELRQELNRVNR